MVKVNVFELVLPDCLLLKGIRKDRVVPKMHKSTSSFILPIILKICKNISSNLGSCKLIIHYKFKLQQVLPETITIPKTINNKCLVCDFDFVYTLINLNLTIYN